MSEKIKAGEGVLIFENGDIPIAWGHVSIDPDPFYEQSVMSKKEEIIDVEILEEETLEVL